MSQKLYVNPVNPGSRSVLMLMKMLNMTNVEVIHVDLFKREQHSDWFKKINPQHTVPTFVERDGHTIWDSHVILIYLLEKYGVDDTLYPEDAAKKSVINQRLFFEAEKLFSEGIKKICGPLVAKERNKVAQSDIEALELSYALLEEFLKTNKWVAGDTLTIADLSLIPTVTSLNYLVPIDKSKFPKITDWIARAEQLPYYECNAEGLNAFISIINQFLV